MFGVEILPHLQLAVSCKQRSTDEQQTCNKHLFYINCVSYFKVIFATDFPSSSSQLYCHYPKVFAKNQYP